MSSLTPEERGRELLDPLDDGSVTIKARRDALKAAVGASKPMQYEASHARDMVAYLDLFDSTKMAHRDGKPCGLLAVQAHAASFAPDAARVLFDALPRFEELWFLRLSMPLSGELKDVSEDWDAERDIDGKPDGALVAVIAAAIPKLLALREFDLCDDEWGIGLTAFLTLMHAFEGHPRIEHIEFQRRNAKMLTRESVVQMLRVFEACPRLRYINVDYESEELKKYAEDEMYRIMKEKRAKTRERAESEKKRARAEA